MKVLFVYSVDDIFSPKKPLRTPEQMQFGISYISSFLKKHGHATGLLVLSRLLGKGNKKLIDEHIKVFSPELICFTTVSTEYNFIAKIAKYIKENYPHIYLLIGGVHVSLNPEKILSDNFDALCIGEGEEPTLELVLQLEEGKTPSDIANLWIKRGLEVERNSPRPFLQDLDDLPFPDREMWADWIEEEEGSRYPILLGRGCPFQCTYCCNHALRKLAKGPYVRFRTPDNIIAELKDFTIKFPTKKDIYLEVETIGSDNAWVLKLCSKLKEFNATLKAPLTFGVNLRITPNMDLESLFAVFKKSNFKTVHIGLESGSERVRRQILGRNYSNQDIINAAGLAKKHGLEVNFYNLIGIPGETVEDFKETIKVNRACLPDKAVAQIFFPYPGTELHSLCVRQGFLKKEPDGKLERSRAPLDFPGFTRKQIQNGFVWFNYHIYKGHRPLQETLTQALVSKSRTNIYLHYIYRRLTYSSVFKLLRKVVK